MNWGDIFPIFLSVILLVSTLHLVSDAEAISWYDETWKFRKQITLDHTKISGVSNLSDFPVLINLLNDPDLKNNNIQSDGDDLLFTASDGVTKLSHETESFNNDSTSGTLVAWVKVPTLYYASDTTIYLYYGKSDAQNQQDSQNVWNSNYRAVWHLKESGVGLNDDFKDSTSNPYHGKGGSTSTQIPAKTSSGKIGNAQDFDGNDDYISVSKNVIDGLTAYTISFWINSATNTANDMIIGENHSSQRFAIKLAESSPYSVQFVKNGNVAASDSEPTSGTWYHYTLAWDKNGGSNNAKWYRNGNLDSQATVSGNMGSLTGDLVIGGDSQSNTWYDVIIDEMRISNVIRSADWIKTEFNNQNNPSGFYTVSSPAVPSVPTSLKSSIGNAQTSLSWSAPSNNGSPITDYVIQYSTDNGSNWITFNDGTSTATSTTVTGLTNGQSYLFRVFAVNSVGSSSSSNVLTIKPSENANSSMYFEPPSISDVERTTMESKGLPSGFTLPSSSVITSSDFDVHDTSFNQYLKFTSPASSQTDMSSLISDYKIPQYSKPSNWDSNTVWAVPPSIIPISDNGGETAVYRVNEITEEKPLFLPFSGSTPLDNGGKLNGVAFTLASGKSASNLNIVSKFLNEPPPGIPTFSEADLYLSFDFSTTENIDFSSQDTFANPPVVSFTMGPVENSVDANIPTNTVNSAITCPNVQVPLITGSIPTTSGISVSRDTSGDTDTACGYTVTLQHFSDYFARAVTSTEHHSKNKCSDCQPPSFTTTFSGESPLKINEKNYNLSQLQNTVNPEPIIVGKSTDLTIHIYENKGPENIQHVSLYTEFPKHQLDPAYANTAITWDKTNGVSSHDPEKNIQAYDVVTNIDGNNLDVTFNIIFAKPMGIEDVVIRTWDSQRNSVDIKILNALNIINNKSDLPLRTKQIQENIEKEKLIPTLKKWGGFDVITASDSEMLHAVGIDGEHIPHWFKKTAKWFVMGQVSEEDLVNALSYLHKNELLKERS